MIIQLRAVLLLGIYILNVSSGTLSFHHYYHLRKYIGKLIYVASFTRYKLHMNKRPVEKDTVTNQITNDSSIFFVHELLLWIQLPSRHSRVRHGQPFPNDMAYASALLCHDEARQNAEMEEKV